MRKHVSTLSASDEFCVRRLSAARFFVPLAPCERSAVSGRTSFIVDLLLPSNTAPKRSASGDNGQEGLVQLAIMIENRGSKLGFRPCDRAFVGIVGIAARENFVAIARRIEEINRLAARDAVTGGADVDRCFRARENVGCA